MRAITAGLLFLLLGPACEAQVSETKVTIGTIEFAARVTLVENGRILRTSVRATNTGRDTTQLLAPPTCTVSLRVYRERWRNETPMWDGARKERVCSDILRMFVLAPHSSVEFVDIDTVAVVGERALPQRLYQFSAVMSMDRGGRLELPAGSARLR